MSTPVSGPLATVPLHVAAGDVAVWWNDPGATWESVPLGSGPAGPQGVPGPAGPTGATGAQGPPGGSNISGTTSGQVAIAGPGNTITASRAYGVSGSSTIIESNASGWLSALVMPAYTGDVTSPGGSIVNTLATTGVSAGSYTNANLTVDAKGRITSAGNGAAGITTGDTPPASPTPGAGWWDSTSGQLYLSYNDGTSTQWVPATNQPGAQGSPGTTGPAGATGPAGPTGATGAAGAPGSTVASGISFAPTGNIAATDVQAALAELDAEKVAKAGDTMTGPLIIPLGAVANTSLNFGGPGCGMWSTNANNVINFSTSSVLRLTIGGAGGTITSVIPYLGPTGTVTAPTYSFSGAATNGFWRSGTNQISVATNGIETMRWNADQSTTAFGPIALPADPTSNLQAATKQYVDAAPNQTTTLSGDVSGSGTAAITTTLATVNASVGTFQGITVNAKGQVTAAANQSYLTANQTVTLSGYATGSGTTAVTVTVNRVKGVVDGSNAAAGDVGEYVVSNITTPVSLTNVTAANLTTISLTAGDWDVAGSVSLSCTGGFTLTYACVSTTSQDVGQSNLANPWSRTQMASATGTQVTETPVAMRLSIAATTTVYLVAFSGFAGTGTAIGILRARRAR